MRPGRRALRLTVAAVVTVPVAAAIGGTAAALESGAGSAWLIAAVQILTAYVATAVAVAILKLEGRPRTQPLWLLDWRGLRRRRARLTASAARSDGQAMLEYGLILTLVVVLAAAAMAILGVDLSELTDEIADAVV